MGKSTRNNEDNFESMQEPDFLEGSGFKKHTDPEDMCDDFVENENNDFESVSMCDQLPRPWGNSTKWRAAASLKTLFQQVNCLAANRKKGKDGSIGDLAHRQRSSDHNPWVLDKDGRSGIVTAIDITNDPANGCNCNVLAKSLQDNKDKRIKYVIWNRQIMSSSVHPWTWRPYTGANPHDKHLHISVGCEKSVCDSTDLWNIKIS
jgi:hypothetical protein